MTAPGALGETPPDASFCYGEADGRDDRDRLAILRRLRLVDERVFGDSRQSVVGGHVCWLCLCRRPVRGTVILTKSQISRSVHGGAALARCRGAEAGDLVEVFETPSTHEFCLVDCYVLESEGLLGRRTSC